MESEILTSITQFISSVGFPIAVAAYLLYDSSKRNGTLENLTLSIKENTLLISELRDDLRNRNENS